MVKMIYNYLIVAKKLQIFTSQNAGFGVSPLREDYFSLSLLTFGVSNPRLYSFQLYSEPSAVRPWNRYFMLQELMIMVSSGLVRSISPWHTRRYSVESC
ncbi:MAG: hypothetical protein JXR76_03130 [Deltaproteobacteria bacterium]|nr:hypothetical protein [Deltaproteobacteria bacterium]